MRPSSRRAFTLVELLVVIAIIGTLVGLLLPAVQAAREAARRTQCQNSLSQLALAVQMREGSKKDVPGYINKLGISGSPNQVRASWMVLLLPYLEQQQLYDLWNNGQIASSTAFPSLAMATCASNPPITIGQPSLSYVCNAGFRNDWDRGDTPTAATATTPALPGYENPANGVFFDRTRRADLGSFTPIPAWPSPGDVRDPEPAPKLSMTFDYIQAKGDGLTTTMMLSESLATLYWAYPLEEYEMTNDANFHFGFTWVLPAQIAANRTLRINGVRTSPTYTRIADMVSFLDADETVIDNPRPGILSSNHPGGVNVAYMDKHVALLDDQIDPFVFAQLMTSNHKLSSLPDDGRAPPPTLTP
jgi:prepilin-type N-terminal cleavage/methylation domain-containing protein